MGIAVAVKTEKERVILTPLEAAGLTAVIVILFIGIFATVYGFPGTLLILGDVIAYAWITDFEKIGFPLIAGMVAISLIAEGIDFFMGLKGIKQFDLSRNGVMASIAGSGAGALIMTQWLMGLGTITGIFLGALAGLLIIDLFERHKLKAAYRPGYGIIAGKVARASSRGLCALIMTCMTMSAIYS